MRPIDADTVWKRVASLAGEQVGVDAAGITPQTLFDADLNYDSIDMVDFVMHMEEEFEIGVEDELVQDVRTVGQARDLVLAKLGQRVSNPQAAL